MAVKVVCPGCGADQEFATGAALRVCDFCKSVIARRDRDVENLGKVVDLVVTQSPLELHMVGAFGGKNFRLVGRAQLAHPKGGVWDEWYASFADGRWGWLAEAQGRFTMMFGSPLGGRVPAWDSVEPGATMPELPGGPWRVTERSSGERRGAAGELPWGGDDGGAYRSRPGERFDFVDLSGEGGAAATIDYGARGGGEPPRLYVGREVTLAELGWADRAPVERAGPTVKADRLACPNCDGAIELVAPDKSLRIGCPFCGQMCDVADGKRLEMLTLLQPKGVKPRLPIGQKGTLAGVAWTVIGFMRRGTKVEGIWYDWDEYLLYEPRAGFRWLVCAQGHWSFVEPIPLASVRRDHAVSHYQGRRYKAFQSGMARVEFVAGEFYWRVEPGEEAKTSDDVAPPYMLSFEGDASELNASHGEYKTRKEIAHAFGVKVDTLPNPMGVAPNQPYPHRRIVKTWAVLVAVTIALAILIFNTRERRELLNETIELENNATQVWFSEPFELRSKRNVEIRITASNLSNEWVYADGDLFDEESGLVQGFDVTAEYYSGSDSDGRWSEGSLTGRRYVSSPPAGLYTMRLEIQHTSFSAPRTLRVTVSQGVPRWTHLLLALLGLSLLPIGVIIHWIMFEKSRWAESSLSWRDS